MSGTDDKDLTATSQAASAPAVGPPVSAGPPAAAGRDFRLKARQAKLRIALSSLSAGKHNTAAGLLLEIFNEHRGTPEGDAAGEALSELADIHEAAGRHRMAADLYDKLSEE